ncbi:asparagine synthase-related protein, partial [Pelagibacteraceae bacterium]|nr:asparagine synthase-related protein [Pelagibacteraceae bacterium]
GFIPPPYTIFENIFCIPLYSGINIKKNVLNLKKFYPKKSSPFKNQDDFENYFSDKILAYPDHKLFLLFSGGSDSLFLFYNLLKKKSISIKNIIVKMKGIEKEYDDAIKISNYYNVKTINFKNFNSDLKDNIDKFLEYLYEPIQDPIVPVYMKLVSSSTDENHKIYFDGQGADSLMMGLPHNLLVNLYHPLSKFFFKLVRYFFRIKTIPNTRFKRLYYRIGKTVNALAKDDWISCFLSSIDIEYNDLLYVELYSCLNDYHQHLKCKHKSIALFFIVIILDSREMQKYRCLNSDVKIRLPFLEKDLIERVFSTNTDFFIHRIFKKKPIYKFVNKYGFKKNNFKTSPFFVHYTIEKKENNIYTYSIKKLSELLQ